MKASGHDGVAGEPVEGGAGVCDGAAVGAVGQGMQKLAAVVVAAHAGDGPGGQVAGAGDGNRLVACRR